MTGRGSFDLRITREFNAPRELVFEQWSNPEYVSHWFAPDGFAVKSCDFAPTEGRAWSVEYTSRAETCHEHGEFLEVRRPARLVFTLSQSDGSASVSETVVIVEFEEVAGGTRMIFRQSGFESGERRDDHAIGWGQCFDKLQVSLQATEAPQ